MITLEPQRDAALVCWEVVVPRYNRISFHLDFGKIWSILQSEWAWAWNNRKGSELFVGMINQPLLLAQQDFSRGHILLVLKHSGKHQLFFHYQFHWPQPITQIFPNMCQNPLWCCQTRPLYVTSVSWVQHVTVTASVHCSRVANSSLFYMPIVIKFSLACLECCRFQNHLVTSSLTVKERHGQTFLLRPVYWHYVTLENIFFSHMCLALHAGDITKTTVRYHIAVHEQYTTFPTPLIFSNNLEHFLWLERLY